MLKTKTVFRTSTLIVLTSGLLSGCLSGEDTDSKRNNTAEQASIVQDNEIETKQPSNKALTTEEVIQQQKTLLGLWQTDCLTLDDGSTAIQELTYTKRENALQLNAHYYPYKDDQCLDLDANKANSFQGKFKVYNRELAGDGREVILGRLLFPNSNYGPSFDYHYDSETDKLMFASFERTSKGETTTISNRQFSRVQMAAPQQIWLNEQEKSAIVEKIQGVWLNKCDYNSFTPNGSNTEDRPPFFQDSLTFTTTHLEHNRVFYTVSDCLTASDNHFQTLPTFSKLEPIMRADHRMNLPIFKVALTPNDDTAIFSGLTQWFYLKDQVLSPVDVHYLSNIADSEANAEFFQIRFNQSFSMQ